MLRHVAYSSMLFRRRGSQVMSTPCLLLLSQSRAQPSLLEASDKFTSVNVLENLFLAVVVLFSLFCSACPPSCKVRQLSLSGARFP